MLHRCRRFAHLVCLVFMLAAILPPARPTAATLRPARPTPVAAALPVPPSGAATADPGLAATGPLPPATLPYKGRYLTLQKN